MSKPYQPSNGSEGAIFIDKYCMQCLNCDPDPDGQKQCTILERSFVFSINDKEYPTEWQYIDGQPTCTAHVKWDWGNDGDPDDPDNPNIPPSQDPDQLCLPFELDFIEESEVGTKTRHNQNSN